MLEKNFTKMKSKFTRVVGSKDFFDSWLKTCSELSKNTIIKNSLKQNGVTTQAIIQTHIELFNLDGGIINFENYENALEKICNKVCKKYINKYNPNFDDKITFENAVKSEILNVYQAGLMASSCFENK